MTKPIVSGTVLFRTMMGRDLAAIITAVWGDGTINLCVFDQDGTTFAKHNVSLAPDDRDAFPFEAHFIREDEQPAPRKNQILRKG